MKAIGYFHPRPITSVDSLVAVDLPDPSPGPRDICVRVRAVSVNPADTKSRATRSPPEGQVMVLGYDAAGVVEAVGAEVTLFKKGDHVFYAGAMDRPGANSQLHLVDERLVGKKPGRLTFAEAAALPLTSITAWELLFTRLAVPYGVKSQKGSILIINGAGGVGSMLIQLARRLTGLTVIATASRPETIQWCREMGAHHVIDHHQPLPASLKRLGIEEVEYVAGLTATDRHLADIVELIAPQGRLALIDDPQVLDITPFKLKCVSVHWELMFTRSLYHTPDMVEQHRILNDIADLVDAGILKTTLTENMGEITVDNLKRAHALIESGRTFGKTVLCGFTWGDKEQT